MIWQDKLQEAVRLASAGQKAEAYQLLKEVVQLNPNEKKAWLWLANVTPDRGEYERALREVLRLDPTDSLAQQGLAFLQQQQQQFNVPPSAPSYTPAPPASTPSYTPPPAPSPYPAQQSSYTPPPPPAYAPYGTPMAPVEVEVRTTQKRRSCLGCGMPGCFGCLGCGGCGVPGCLIALIVLFIAPIVLCAGLSYTNASLGPLDAGAAYLPGEFGRKEISFTAPIDGKTYEVTAKVNRTWYVADSNDDWWPMWRDALEGGLPFEDTTKTWADYEVSAGQVPEVIDVNPVSLAEGGGMIGMTFVNTATGDYSCAAVRQAHAGDDPVEYDGGLCGYRTSTVTPWTGGVVFKGTNNINAPVDIRDITFFVPLDESTAAQWKISLPDKVYEQLKEHIDTTIKSMKITLK